MRNFAHLFIYFYVFLAQLVHSTAELFKSPFVRRLSVRPSVRPSVDSLHLETVQGILLQFGSIVPITILSWPVDQFSEILILKFFMNFFRFCYNGSIWELKFQNASSPTVFVRLRPN